MKRLSFPLVIIALFTVTLSVGCGVAPEEPTSSQSNSRPSFGPDSNYAGHGSKTACMNSCLENFQGVWEGAAFDRHYAICRDTRCLQ